MIDQQDHLPRRSRTTWLARIAAVATVNGNTGFDLTFAIAVVA